MNSLQHILEQIRVFVKKYYTNRLLRGLIIFFTLFILLFLFFSLTEYYARLGTSGRSVIFFGGIILMLTLFGYYIFIPVAKLLKIGKTMTVEQSAQELTKRLPELKDRLLNIIDLKNRKPANEELNLLNAAIEQKSAELRVVDFGKAVNFKVNYKYLRFFILIAIIFTALMVSNPAVITESTKRIIDYNTEYIRPSKVVMRLLNENLQVKRGNNLRIEFESIGEVNPAEVYLNFGGKKLQMQTDKGNLNTFAYTFQNLNNSFDFFVTAGDFTSQKFDIKVLNPPLITNFLISVKPPAYTGETDTVYRNIGDITVPYGSRLIWNFTSVAVDSLLFKKDSVIFNLEKDVSGFKFVSRIINNISYGIKPLNKFFTDENFINYSVTVIPDLFPQIVAEQKTDSSLLTRRYFRGYVQDDYGINKLVFRYRVTDSKNPKVSKPYTTVKIPIGNSPGRQEFFHSFNFTQVNPKPDETIEYYFEVFDNDAVAGSKSSKSKVFYYKVPSFEEQLAQFDNINEKSQNSVSEAMKMTQEINKALKDFQKSFIDNSKEDWENKQFLQDMQTKQEQLNQMIEKAKQEIEKAKELGKMNEQDEELLKKLEELQKMTEELLTDEIRELMDELNKLMEKYDEKKMQELLDKQKDRYEDLDKMLDRNLELLKRFKVEQKAEQIANELDKLSEEMNKLSEETEKGKTSDEEIQKKQDELKKKFDKLSEEYKKNLEENKKLEQPFGMENFENETQDINNEFQKSEEMMQKSKNKKASKSQKSNAGKMKKMAQAMKQMMQSAGMQANSENIEQLQALVQDLLTLSFEQETNMKNIKKINYLDPKYPEYGERQIQLKNDYGVVADSLYALSKRMFILANLINKETKNIDENFEFSLENLVEKKTTNVVNGQHKIMESFNNLALILSQLASSMQQSMQGQGTGNDSQSKQNKSGKPSFDGLKKQQQGLKQQLQDMIKQMKQQGNKPGKMPSSKQLTDMLARQEIFRQKLEEMKSKHSLQQDTKKLLDEISELGKKNEQQLINKQITPELLERQQLIETRLLEAEQAENKRKTDPKRESKNPKEIKYESPEDFFKDEQKDSSIKENLNKNSMILTPFYRKTYDRYNNNIK